MVQYTENNLFGLIRTEEFFHVLRKSQFPDQIPFAVQIQFKNILIIGIKRRPGDMCGLADSPDGNLINCFFLNFVF